MPPIVFVLFVLNAVSVIILGAAGWLGWSWYEGQSVVATDGTVTTWREDWQLWTATGLLAWSVLGRLVVLPLLTRADTLETKAERGQGTRVEGVDGASLYVETVGSRRTPTIVLTHGWGLDSTIWNYAKGSLGQRFRVVAWDLPGAGQSKTGRANGVSLTAFAANLRALIKTLDGPVILVGHSIGGMTIQTLARDYPEMMGREVAGVVLVNTTHINPLRTILFSPLFQALRLPVLIPLLTLTIWLQPLAWMMAWMSYLNGMAHVANRLGFGRFVTRSQLEHTTLLAVRNPPAVLARGNLAMFEWDATADLPLIAVPTLVIGGDKDIVTRLEASRTIAFAVPQARLKVIDGVNHMGFLERADLYNAAVSDFVDGLAVPSPLPRSAAA